MKFIKFPFLAIFINSAVLYSQQLPAGYTIEANIEELLRMKSGMADFSAGKEETRGTPYVVDSFRNGNIYFANKTIISGKLLNYDCFSNQVHFSEGGKVYILNSQNIDYFTITGNEKGKTMLFKQVFIESEKKRLFMQIIYEKKSILYKRCRKEFIEADYTGPYNQNRRHDEYIDHFVYYIALPGKEIQQIRPKKNVVINLFNDKKMQVDEFIRQEKINLKEEENLIRLVKYYDGL